jgi:hypothetical protein
MKKYFIALIILSILFVAGCKSYSLEVQGKLEECKKIIDWGECEMALAIEQNDASICKFIKNRYYQEVCSMMVNKQFDKCAEIQKWDFSERTPDLKELDYDMKKYAQAQARAILIPTKSATIRTCYSWSAVLSNDMSKCNNLKNLEYQNDRDSCIMNYAKEKSDLSLCANIQDENTKQYCLKEE